MRIMIVGGNQLKYTASRYYDYANKLANGFIRNGHAVIRFFDRDMARLGTLIRSRKLGRPKANKALLGQVASFEPDLVVFVHADVILPETLTLLRDQAPNTALVQINVDPLFMPGTVSRVGDKSPLLDASFMTTAGAGLKKISGGKPAYYIPNIVDPSMESHRAFATDTDIDLIFACGSYDREGGDPRKASVDVVRERLPDINFLHTVDNTSGGIWGIDYMRTLGRSKCGLNMSREREGPLNLGTADDFHVYSSDRVAHLTGNGVLAFTHARYHMDQLFSADEMVFYDSNEDLADKIVHYLGNDAERKRLAENGWKKSHAHYNERLAADFILDVALGRAPSHTYAWPTDAVS